MFYSIHILPPWAQTASYANPIMYMVNAFRFGFFGVSDVNIPASFAITIGLAVLLFTWAVMMMNVGRGIRDWETAFTPARCAATKRSRYTFTESPCGIARLSAHEGRYLEHLCRAR